MEHYAGIEVSLEQSSVCVVDERGRIVREGKVGSEPEALIGWFSGLGMDLSLIQAGGPVEGQGGAGAAAGCDPAPHVG